MVEYSPVVTYKKPARRIAYIHDTNVYGGVEVFLLLLMKYLDPERYTPSVIVPGYTDPDRSSPARFIQQVQDMGVPLIRLPVASGLRGLSSVIEIQKTVQLLKSEKFDIAHTHTCRPTGARKTTLSSWLAGIPIRLRTEHGPPLGVTPLTPYLVKPLDWITQRVLTVSDATLQDEITMVHRSPKKLYRSYGGIELNKFNPHHNVREAKLKLGLNPDIPVVGQVGRLTIEKGHTYLIKAAPRIIEQYGPVNFLLVGEGYLENELKQQVKDLNMSQYVQVTGYQPNLQDYMEAMDIGVMPSVWEGLGLALLEFMALGKPTVTSAVPCFKEVIVDGESGLIATLDEENSLADNILRLLRNPEMAATMGQAALQRVRTHFSVQRLANDMMDLYDQLLQVKTPQLVASQYRVQ